METTLASITPTSILVSIVIGLVAGGLARLILPGKQSMNLLFTMLLGIAGSFIGSYIAGALKLGGDPPTLLWQILFATGGALILLVIFEMLGVFKKKR